jgi:hypothetical protein
MRSILDLHIGAVEFEHRTQFFWFLYMSFIVHGPKA